GNPSWHTAAASQDSSSTAARAPGHRIRRHRRRSRAPGEAGREEDRFREALVGHGSAHRAALLRGPHAAPRKGPHPARVAFFYLITARRTKTAMVKASR